MFTKVLSNVSTFGVSLIVKQPSSLLSICVFNKYEKQLKTSLIFKNSTKTRNCKSLFKQILPWEKS